MKLQAVSIVAAPLLASLHKAAFTTHADWDSDFFQKLLVLPTTRGLIATDADMPVGFILWQQTIDAGEIITIAVAPAAQRRGVGRALLNAYEAMLQEDRVTSSVLDVAADNMAAVQLYGNAGYQQVHLRPGYYQLYEQGVERRIDALVLQKLL